MATGAPLPVREHTSAAEMQRHAAEVKARLFATPERLHPAKPKPVFRDAEMRPLLAAAPQAEPWVTPEVIASYNETIGKHSTRRTVRQIIEQVAHQHDMTTDDLTGPSRVSRIVRVRELAIVAVRREHPEMSLARTGHFFGGRDHSTVLAALARFSKFQTLFQRQFQLLGRPSVLRQKANARMFTWAVKDLAGSVPLASLPCQTDALAKVSIGLDPLQDQSSSPDLLSAAHDVLPFAPMLATKHRSLRKCPKDRRNFR